MMNKMKFGSVVLGSLMVVSFSLATIGHCAESVTGRENLDKLIKTHECRGCDLSGVNLNRLDLSDADLEGADLSGAQMSLTNLARANLKNTNLRGVVFGGSDLGDADLRGADLRGTSLDGAYIGGALLDGVFVSTKLYEDGGNDEVKTEIYIDNPSRPKQKPETNEVVVAPRRVFEEPPPAVEVDKTPPAGEQQVAAASAVRSDRVVPEVNYPQAPKVKKPLRLQAALIEEKKNESAVVKTTSAPAVSVPEKPAEEPDLAVKETHAPEVAATPVIAKTQTAENSVQVASKEPISSVVPVEEKTVSVEEHAPEVAVAPVVARPETAENSVPAVAKEPVPSVAPAEEETASIKEQPISDAAAAASVEEQAGPATDTAEEVLPDIPDDTGVAMKNLDLAADKKKRDNLARLFDTKKCYGCDLSGMDLSGENLDSADLEKADLTDCNLEETDLENANLKGAVLVNANLRGADLEEADLYKADLSGADLTGAIIKGALFDNAETAGSVGINMEEFLLKD